LSESYIRIDTVSTSIASDTGQIRVLPDCRKHDC
jgi:hypothetical protein